MNAPPYNALVVLGPTASGKTALGVQLAHTLGGEILSADSRQVYRGLDIGAGKDLNEYRLNGLPIPYHLIDIVDLDTEFNVFAYQRAFFDGFEAVRARNRLPVIVGGTGLYLDAVLSGYRMIETPQNPQLRAELAAESMDALAMRLLAIKPGLHNTTDLTDRERLIRAIEIAAYSHQQAPEPAPGINALVLGTRWDRQRLRERITLRLKARLDSGLIEEVQALLDRGVSFERLDLLGLEYRFVALFLHGEIRNRNDLFQKLQAAIAQFAKRQDTWFRRMERRGTIIHWIDEANFAAALRIVREHA